MSNYQIFIDLSGDIDVNFAKENNIGLIPMQYSLGDDFRTAEYVESDEVLKKFYDSQRNGDLTKTTQITPYLYEEFFKPLCEKGISILYIPLSKGLSKTYESALLAKTTIEEEYPNVKVAVVESLAATGGIGVLAQKAVENQNNGMSLEENFNDINNKMKTIRHWFLVEDLKYLKRGGRISATTAILGTALKIKPILEVNNEGKLDTIAKMHGSKKAALYLVDKFKETRDENEKCVYISHADNLELANFVKEKLLEIDNALDIKVCMLSPIIGAHTGPGMTAICHFAKEEW